jgi:Uncharacterized protein involved in formation of curli polymers
MKKSVFVLLSLMLILAPRVLAQKVIGDAAKELAEQIAASAAKQQKHKIAVIPFRELDGRTTIFGTYLAEELVTNLFMTGNLEIVERSLLDKLMAELKLNQTGAIDPDSAKKVGKIAGVEAIVTGSITDLQSYVGVNCRLIDTETGKIFGAAQTKVVKDADLQKVMSIQTPDPTAPAAPAPTPKATKATVKTTFSGIEFELVGCLSRGGNVVCNLMLTNETSDDKRFQLNITGGDQATLLIDDQSNENRGRAGALGIEHSDYPAWLSTTLVPGIPLKAQARFGGIPDSVSGIRLLRIQCTVAGNYGVADFRNVPLTK